MSAFRSPQESGASGKEQPSVAFEDTLNKRAPTGRLADLKARLAAAEQGREEALRENAKLKARLGQREQQNKDTQRESWATLHLMKRKLNRQFEARQENERLIYDLRRALQQRDAALDEKDAALVAAQVAKDVALRQQEDVQIPPLLGRTQRTNKNEEKVQRLLLKMQGARSKLAAGKDRERDLRKALGGVEEELSVVKAREAQLETELQDEEERADELQAALQAAQEETANLKHRAEKHAYQRAQLKEELKQTRFALEATRVSSVALREHVSDLEARLLELGLALDKRR